MAEAQAWLGLWFGCGNTCGTTSSHCSSLGGWGSDQAKQLWWGRRNSSTSVIGNFSCWVQRFCCSSDCSEFFLFQQLSLGSAQRAHASLCLEYFSPNKEKYSAVPLIYNRAISIQQKDTWNITGLRILCNLSHFSLCQGEYKKLKP